MQNESFFLVHCLDAPGAEQRRAAAQPAHRQYIQQHRDRIFIGGPLVDDARKTLIGSMLVLRAASREQAQAFMDAEPYNANGVFESVVIRAFECVIQPQNEQAGATND